MSFQQSFSQALWKQGSTQGSKHVPFLFLALPWPALGGGWALQRDMAAWPEGKKLMDCEKHLLLKKIREQTPPTNKSWVGQGETAWVYLPPRRIILYSNISNREPQCTVRVQRHVRKTTPVTSSRTRFNSGNHWDS